MFSHKTTQVLIGTGVVLCLVWMWRVVIQAWESSIPFC
jgi:hypothetical protein